MPYTQGFQSPLHLTVHFLKHAEVLDVKTEMEYLEKADEFMGAALNETTPHVHECVRGRENDILRFNEMTNEFGVMRNDGIIRTYCKLTYQIIRYGSGLNYFRSECAK